MTHSEHFWVSETEILFLRQLLKNNLLPLITEQNRTGHDRQWNEYQMLGKFFAVIQKNMKEPEIRNNRNRICSSIYGCTNDALVERPNLLPAPPSPQIEWLQIYHSCAGIMCISFYALCKWHTFAH